MNIRALVWASFLAATTACTMGQPPNAHQAATPRPPAATSMDPRNALGLWHSNFGAVKVEQDSTRAPDGVMGVWTYERDGQEVIGFFSGAMRGNVLEFTWNEPAQPVDLTGGGYVSFDPAGAQFSGRWWTDDQRRGGMWTGWRSQQAQPAGAGPNPFGGSSYGELQGNPYGGSSYGNLQGNPYGGSSYGNTQGAPYQPAPSSPF